MKAIVWVGLDKIWMALRRKVASHADVLLARNAILLIGQDCVMSQKTVFVFCVRRYFENGVNAITKTFCGALRTNFSPITKSSPVIWYDIRLRDWDFKMWCRYYIDTMTSSQDWLWRHRFSFIKNLKEQDGILTFFGFCRLHHRNICCPGPKRIVFQ